MSQDIVGGPSGGSDFYLDYHPVFSPRMALRPRLRSSVRGNYGTGIYYRLGRVGGCLGVLALRAAMAREVLTESKKFAAMRNKLENIALVRRREMS